MISWGKLIEFDKSPLGSTEARLKHVYLHDSFLNDWTKLFPDRGKQKAPARNLRRRLQIAMEEREQTGQRWFKHLKGTDGLCRIEDKGEVNLRALLVFRERNKQFSVILLSAFAEKDRKQGGGTSYARRNRYGQQAFSGNNSLTICGTMKGATNMCAKLLSGVDFFNEALEGVDAAELELDDFLVDVAIQLIRARKANGWTQSDAAAKSDVKQAMISKLESGEYNPSLITLWKYARSLGALCRVNVLLQTVENSILVKPLSSEEENEFLRDSEYEEDIPFVPMDAFSRSGWGAIS